ncbi:hypothetical protein BU16DRAFT_526109 [Lophium mytilinum]|uniref:Zn(2)-C6 fungal-type domain-containing protein n=1 Tax=Lophium mytilinum TaxID=390894 RepID=A0A6A6QZM3_9PEZI|nr:hypothetical protein BU16DRAFT_526109 [Lophium mytilinum]
MTDPNDSTSQTSRPGVRREGSARLSEESSPRIAHTLTACCRCRTRKTRCDPGLPRCGPCERTNSHCEYYDPTKGTKIPRNYVVHLQHKVRDLEKQLADLERDDIDPDPEDVMRGAASVRIQESDESKFLGPSSGIAITRLVMQLAKQFTDSKSISDIVPQSRARSIKERFAEEEAKPTSKVYPLISDVAAEELPNRDLMNLLLQLFDLKVHPMYPMFHEPTLAQDVQDVYGGSTDAYQNFVVRMVIAISLQKMDTQYAGLADSYYLAALKYLQDSIKPMNLKTLQCFCLIAGYSLLTPTRTAVYYIVGLAVRLTQALGLNEEKTITRGPGGAITDPLELDMRRRLFWCVLTMDFGLSHSLGRPSIYATRQAHIDVGWYELCDDQYITREGIKPAPQASLKKWISIHFFKMRLLQLEIRRKLYQKKRAEPKDDQDPWFHQMETKMKAWRDTSPEMDGGSGLNKAWFIGRYNTMVVFLFRPCPQVPRPTVTAARKCYDACQYNIYMSRKQIETGSVDLTWIFTQAIFMTINTILWTLSYSEIRRTHTREEVEGHLTVALEAIDLASVRWPGVASAHELYRNLIAACLRIYDKDGDIPISAGSPSESASVTSSLPGEISRSRTTSPATVSTPSLNTPPERVQPPFGYISPQQPMPFTTQQSQPSLYQSSPPPQSQFSVHQSPSQAPIQHSFDTSPKFQDAIPNMHYDPHSQYNPMPATFSDLPQWNPSFSMPYQEPYSLPPVSHALTSPSYNESYAAQNGFPVVDYLNPQWSVESRGMGLNAQQQLELMHSLEANETSKIEAMIQQSNALFSPRINSY